MEQIKKIIVELGEDSYIGAAFDGCFEVAEENIANLENTIKTLQTAVTENVMFCVMLA